MSFFNSQQILKLQKIDDLFRENSISFLSLSPDKEFATSIKTILEDEKEVLITSIDVDRWIDFCTILVEETIENFHENIFWDFDYLIHSLCLEYKLTKNRIEFIEERKAKIRTIFRIFGSKSAIRFKYIHDFLYGYDWYKWQTQIKERIDNLQPFGLEFLNYIEGRGIEILDLIEQNDKNYPFLESEESRNPFYFSRCIEDEILLWKSLSKDNCIPITAWKKEPNLTLDKNFSELRNKRAQELKITSNQSPGAHKI